MANRYWVGGSGSWDASDTTHWSTSSGGAGGASVPGSGDVAIFDANSGTGTVSPDSGMTAVSGVTTTNSSVAFNPSGQVRVTSGTVNMGVDMPIYTVASSSVVLQSNGYSIGDSVFGGNVTCSDAMNAGALQIGVGQPPPTLKLKAGVTSTITSISISNATIKSTVDGSQAILSDSSGTNQLYTPTVQDIWFTGGADWYWAPGYVDNGNVLGIYVQPASIAATGVLFGTVA